MACPRLSNLTSGYWTGSSPSAHWRILSLLHRCTGTGQTSFAYRLCCLVFRRLRWHMPRPCQPGTPMSTVPFLLPNRGPGPVPLLRKSLLRRGPIFATTVTSPVTSLLNALSHIGHVNAAALLLP